MQAVVEKSMQAGLGLASSDGRRKAHHIEAEIKRHTADSFLIRRHRR